MTAAVNKRDCLRLDEMVPVYLVWIKAMTVTVIFLRYEVKDSEKIRHFETTPSLLFFSSKYIKPARPRNEHVQLFTLFYGNNCIKQQICAIVGLFLIKQLHNGYRELHIANCRFFNLLLIG